MSGIRLSLIAAVARNGVIGRDNRLPWRLKGDLRFFKDTTMGKPMIMGRKTWESLGAKPLPGRPHLVLTRDPGYQAAGAVLCRSLPDALSGGTELARQAGTDELMVIGGEQIFQETLGMADRLYLTEVAAEPEGDAFFPAFDRAAWVEREITAVPAQGDGSPAYRILILDRRPPCS